MQLVKTSLHNDQWSRSGWLEEGTTLLLSAMSSRWDIGDWALRTPPEASREEIKELLEEAAARSGYGVNSIRDLRTVAERIPLPLRNRRLSWYAYKEIARLIVSGSEEQSVALRTEFVDEFAARPEAKILDVRSAVRKRMGKGAVEPEDMVNVSFKLTTAEHSDLRRTVEADPVHETVSDFLQAHVREFIASQREISQ
jgi:hypothetical protein